MATAKAAASTSTQSSSGVFTDASNTPSKHSKRGASGGGGRTGLGLPKDDRLVVSFGKAIAVEEGKEEDDEGARLRRRRKTKPIVSVYDEAEAAEAAKAAAAQAISAEEEEGGRRRSRIDFCMPGDDDSDYSDDGVISDDDKEWSVAAKPSRRSGKRKTRKLRVGGKYTCTQHGIFI